MSAKLDTLFAEHPPGYDRLIDGPYCPASLLKEMDAVRADIADLECRRRRTPEQRDLLSRLWLRHTKLWTRYARGH